MAFADEDTDIHLEELNVADSSKLVDVTLKDSGIRNTYNMIILSVVKGDGTMLFNPSADTCIRAGDTVIAVGSEASLVKLGKVMNP